MTQQQQAGWYEIHQPDNLADVALAPELRNTTRAAACGKDGRGGRCTT